MASQSSNDDLEFLLQRSVAVILKSEDPVQFLRWFDQSAEVIAPDFFSAFAAGPEALRSFKSFFSRYIWNRTPLPGNHFRPQPLPKPERNAPCLCGSGHKYKQFWLRMGPALPSKCWPHYLSICRRRNAITRSAPWGIVQGRSYRTTSCKL